jgi:pimeloyl-ACP methyl ester carboxylesterase
MYASYIMTDISNKTTPEQLAPWIRSEDRIPLLLAVSLYGNPRKELQNFRMLERNGSRAAAWMDREGVMIVGTRGTTPFSANGLQDLMDDVNISGADYCNLSLVKVAEELVQKYSSKAKSIIFVGHSLGGTSALCLTSKYSNYHLPVRGISFNAGAAPTNPILSGPGPQKFRQYHIVGDLISSHMGPQAAEVIRIKKSKALFGGTYAHSTPRMLAADGDWTYATPDEEDALYYEWGRSYKPGWDVLIPGAALGKFLRLIISNNLVEKNPIPGSTRFNNK